MLRRFRGQAKQRSEEPVFNDDVQEDVIIVEERFLQMLSPFESHIMSLQSLLVWENPQRSAALLIGVNVLFWLATTMRIYYLIGLTGAVVSFVDLWRNFIWPEIRVPVPTGDDEEWIPVHPRLLSVHELCHHAARHWVDVSKQVHDAIELRRRNHAKFYVKSTISLLLLAMFGYYVSGIYICYITVMGCLLLPCAIYHQLFSKLYQHMQPCVSNMEQRLNIKRTRSKKGKKGKKKRGGEMPDPIESKMAESETEEDELSEFIPSITPAPTDSTTTSAAPHISDTDSDPDHPGLLSPPPAMTSRTPSRDDQLLNSDDETSFSLTPADSQMPHIDHVDSSLADMSSLPSLHEESSLLADTNILQAEVNIRLGTNRDLDFVNMHFKESSEEELESHLAQNLDLPEFDESARAEEAEVQEQQASTAQALFLAAALQNSQVVSDTVSNLVTSTFSGLSQLRQTVMPPAPAAAADSSADSPAAPMNSSDIVEAEFEFLSQEDLDDSLLEAGITKD